MSNHPAQVVGIGKCMVLSSCRNCLETRKRGEMGGLIENHGLVSSATGANSKQSVTMNLALFPVMQFATPLQIPHLRMHSAKLWPKDESLRRA